MHKGLLTLIIAFFFIKINAQVNGDSISIYFNKKKYEKVINYCSKKGDYVSLINLTNQLFEENNFEMTIIFSLKSIELGKDEISLEQKVNSYQLIGFSYLQLKDFKNSISFINKSIQLGDELINENDKILLYNILGHSYIELNDIENAEKNYINGISLNTLYSKGYFQTLFSLCSLYQSYKEFSIAEKQGKIFLFEALNQRGKNSQEYILALKNLSLLYLSNDKYNLAEEYILKSIDQNKFKFGEKSIETINSSLNLVNLYGRQGKLIEAEKLNILLLNNYLEDVNQNPKDTALLYNSLASIQQELFKYNLAELNFSKAIKIIKDNYGEINPEYALISSNIGVFFLIIERYNDAEFYLKKAIEIKNTLESNPDNTSEYYNLAVCYNKTNRCSEAEVYNLKSLKNINNEIGESYKTKLISLSEIYNCLKNTQKEFENLLIVSNLIKNKVLEITNYQTNDEIEKYIEKYISERNYPLSFLNRNPEQYSLMNISCFEEELLMKNILIHNQQNVKKNILKSDNIELINKFEQFIKNKKQISNFNELPNEKSSLSHEDLILKTEYLEKYLVKQSKEFSKLNKSISIQFSQIQNKLLKNELIIDFIDFTNYDPQNKIYKKVYFAFVLRKDFKSPRFIFLFEEKKLDALLSRNKNQQDYTLIDKQYLDKNISELFLNPIENELKDINTVYLSLSGLSYQINFAALPVNSKQNFGEKYKLHVLNSPAELIDYKVSYIDNKNKIDLLLYGGIDYTESKGNSSLNINDNSISSTEDFINLSKRSGFEKLPGTLQEVVGINSNAKKNGFNSKILKESEATEESIKALDGKNTPYVLHLATHGFFFPQPNQEMQKDILSSAGKSKIYKTSDDPMMRSGLLLAGAKNYWGKSNQNNTIEDGILTASEISNLDLSACELVVLSACETGLGEVKGSEGVFGLQRAFKMAGVKNIIMSLWKVPDTQTAELFDIFYSECFAGKSIHEAFQAAQSKMKAKYSPYYWAGFVLLE